MIVLNFLLHFYMSVSQHLILVSSLTSALSSTFEGHDCSFKVQSNFFSGPLSLYFKLSKFMFQIFPLFTVKHGSMGCLSAVYCRSDSEAEPTSQNRLHALWKNVEHMVIIFMLIKVL